VHQLVNKKLCIDTLVFSRLSSNLEQPLRPPP